MSETYNGWTNRETWAVALWIDNDQGWHESVLDALREMCNTEEHTCKQSEWVGHWNRRAGEIIKNNVEGLITVDGYAEQTGEDHLPPELSRVAEDIGSLYRVNWDEIGEAFLKAVDESKS